MALTESQKRNAEKNQRYWRKREEEALQHYVADEEKYDREIRRIYTDMLDGIEGEINAFYGRYAAAEGISIAEAKKRVSKADIAAYERKAKKYVEAAAQDRKLNGGKTNTSGYYFSERANEEMRLYNATMRINRLEMLKANIGLELIKGHAELESFMDGILRGRTEEELARQAGILGKTVRNNAAKAHAIVNGSFHNATFSERIWQQQGLMKADLEKLLARGLIQGKNARALTKDLRKYLIGDKHGKGATYNVERLMRTELARVQTEAQKQSFIRNGFDHYEFIANSGCCDICQEKNGKHFPVEKMMPGENAPPLHPHCRCSTAAWEDNDEYEAWLDYLDKGGTTADWNKFAKAAWMKQAAMQMAAVSINSAAAAKQGEKAVENSGNAEYNADGAADIQSLSLRFMSNRDTVYDNLKRVPPLEGYEDIACHADPRAFGFIDPETDETIQEASAKMFATRVKDSGKYNGGAIRLIACESGKYDDGLAQKFANEMGCPVLAPNKKVYTNSQGYMVLADSDEEAAVLLKAATDKWNDEGWKVFKPKGE